MTAPMLVAREGRPPTTVNGLRRALEREQLRLERAELERLAEHDESRLFAERVLQIGLELAGGSMSRQMVMNLGGELAYRSGRRLTQLGSVVL